MAGTDSPEHAIAEPRFEPAPRVVAFYLPQFHPTPENDEWWGRGFTEWTNVVKARPLFRKHEQPHLPGDLGFYDLRVPETREAQAELARKHGVTAFCYWHYWFAGRRLLERPFAEVLATRRPDFPFMLAWANQTWSGVWHGAPDRILMEQTYPGPADEQAHFRFLLEAFTDNRYLLVNGKPVFYIFRPEQLPDPAAFVDRWQTMASKAGFPGLYLLAEVSDLIGDGPRYTAIEAAGFDAGVYVRIPANTTVVDRLKMRFRRKVFGGPEVYSLAEFLPHPPSSLRSPLHPCVYPNWDSTPRSGRRGIVITGTSPEAFGRHVQEGLQRTLRFRPDERLLFVKSWNEWAEGNYLEPDRVHGLRYLEVLASRLAQGSLEGNPSEWGPSGQ